MTWKRLCYPYLALSPGLGFKIITIELPKNCVKCSNLKYSAGKNFSFPLKNCQPIHHNFLHIVCVDIIVFISVAQTLEVDDIHRIQLLCAREMRIYLIFQDDESEFDHFQDEEEFEGFDSERVGSSGKMDDKEAPKITITKV